MCWDISLRADIQSVKDAFPQLGDHRRERDRETYHMENVQALLFPDYPIIYREKDEGTLGLTEMEWGVLPTYIEEAHERESHRRSMVNIRSERVLGDKKSLWYRLKDQRCLIPVSGTFEHRKIQGRLKKIPYYIAEKGRDLFYVPGLYQWHETMDEDGVIERKASFGMMTREANAVMRNIHNDGPNKHRMPLFLHPDMEKEWLSDIHEVDMQHIFQFEINPEELEYYSVYTLRGYPQRPDGGHRYDPFLWKGLPPLGNDDGNPVQGSLF